MVEKSTLLPRNFFNVISLVKKSMVFLLTFFEVSLMLEKSTLLARIFLDKISMSSTSILLSYKLMKTFEGIFPS